MTSSNSSKIFIDVNDEINFVVEKLLQADSDRVILVVPQNALVVSSLISMQILAKQVAKTKKVLVLVTEDEFGLQLALRSGLGATQKVSNVTPEMWEAATIKKQKLIEQLEKRKKLLLTERGAISEMPEGSNISELDGNREYVMGHQGTLEEVVEEPQAGNTESSIGVGEEVEEVEKNELGSMDTEVVGGTEEDLQEEAYSEEKREEEREETKTEEGEVVEEEIIGPIHRKRLEPKVQQIGGFTIVGGGDIASLPERGNIGPLNMDKEKRERSLRSKTAPASFTGRDWTKYTDTKDKPSSLRDKLPVLLKRSSRTRMKPLEGSRKKKAIILGVVLGFLLFLSLGTYVLAFQFSSLDLFITLAKTEVPIEEQITADPGITDVNIETLSIPVETINDDTLSTSADSKATGTGVRGDKASGVIEIWNYLEQEITIEAGTAIVSNRTNLVYELREKATIAAAEKNGVVVTPGGMAKELWVQAKEVGEDYNTSSADGEVTLKVGDYATSEVVGKLFREIKGGTSEEFVSVSQEDIDKVKTSLTETLTSQGKSKLQNLVPVGYKLLSGTEEFTESEVTSVPALGEAADSFSVTLKGEITALIVKENDLRLVVEEIVATNEEVGEGLELDNLTSLAVANVVKQEDGKVTFTIASSGSLKSSITKEDIQTSIAGKSMSDAISYLSSLSDITEYRLEFFPQIVPESIRYVPSDTSRIKVRIN